MKLRACGQLNSKIGLRLEKYLPGMEMSIIIVIARRKHFLSISWLYIKIS